MYGYLRDERKTRNQKQEKTNMKKNQIKLIKIIQLKREIVNWTTFLRKRFKRKNGDTQNFQVSKRAVKRNGEQGNNRKL